NLAPQLCRDARALTVGEGPNEALTMFLGRSASDTDTVGRLLGDQFGVPQLGRRLQEAAQEIKARCLGPGAPSLERSAALSWAHLLAGRAAADALLVAAVQVRAEQQPATNRHRVLEWARLRLETSLERALRGDPLESLLLGPRQAAELVSSYAGAIGDVEQNLPGEEDALDPLLRRSPLPVDPSAGLPGSVPLDGFAQPTNGQPMPPTPEQLTRLSPAAKRDFLERLLRQQVSQAQSDLPTPSPAAGDTPRPRPTSDPLETC